MAQEDVQISASRTEKQSGVVGELEKLVDQHPS
jgi:hypothetical protein